MAEAFFLIVPTENQNGYKNTLKVGYIFMCSASEGIH